MKTYYVWLNLLLLSNLLYAGSTNDLVDSLAEDPFVITTGTMFVDSTETGVDTDYFGLPRSFNQYHNFESCETPTAGASCYSRCPFLKKPDCSTLASENVFLDTQETIISNTQRILWAGGTLELEGNYIQLRQSLYYAGEKIVIKCDTLHASQSYIIVGKRILMGTWTLENGDFEFDHHGKIFTPYSSVKGHLGRSILTGAQFISLNLRAVDFEQSDLTNAVFTDSDLTGTRLEHATVRGASFEDATGLTDEQKVDLRLRGARI